MMSGWSCIQVGTISSLVQRSSRISVSIPALAVVRLALRWGLNVACVVFPCVRGRPHTGLYPSGRSLRM